MTIDFVGTGDQLTRDEIAQRAVANRVQPPVLMAVIDIEAGGEGYISATDLRMKALFEAHLFSRFTDHKFDASYPDVSSRSWNKALYGAGGAHQYDRIARAMKLDENAALQATSWGLGQVLGMNHQMVGFNTPQDMVLTLKQSEDAQFDAMLKFCQKSGALRKLQGPVPDFVGFTEIYNGRGQVPFYAGRLKGAYFKALQDWKTPTKTPRTEPKEWNGVLVEGLEDDPRVMKLQEALRDAGFYRVPPYRIDGDFGNGTEWAVMQYQTSKRFVRDGVAGPQTLDGLGLHFDA